MLLRSKINAARFAPFAGLLVLAGAVRAEVPAAVTTQLGTIPTDAASIGALVLVAVGAIFAFKLLRRAL